jgi:hypothetical protein
MYLFPNNYVLKVEILMISCLVEESWSQLLAFRERHANFRDLQETYTNEFLYGILQQLECDVNSAVPIPNPKPAESSCSVGAPFSRHLFIIHFSHTISAEDISTVGPNTAKRPAKNQYPIFSPFLLFQLLFARIVVHLMSAVRLQICFPFLSSLQFGLFVTFLRNEAHIWSVIKE